ncbi:MAG TPA: homoserine dehydrogenase [Gemmatimonadaceae bacterium]
MTRLNATAAHSQIGYVPRAPSDSSRTLRIGLAGCGVVGGALVKLLDECSDAIAARHGLRIEIARVLVRDVRRDRGLPLGTDIFTSDIESFIAEDVDVVIEAIGGEDAAARVARAALGSGKRFITANKELIAGSGCELTALARTFDGSLDFGAAVGGSAPVISLLRDLLGASAPTSIRGILNGTSNYVLTQIERGKSFGEALAAARRRGLAESDATRDLDGRDAAAKLAIIAWISFGISPIALPIRRIGLPADPSGLVRHAADIGARIRPIAECVVLPGSLVTATVEPTVVSRHGSFGRTELEENRVEVDLGWPAPLSVSGPGAGGAPTATALLGDLLNSFSPKNDRGPVRRAFTPVDDPREHRWLIVGACRAAILRGVLLEAGIIGHEAFDTGLDARVTTAARWSELSSALSLLRLREIDASVARFESPDSSSELQ